MKSLIGILGIGLMVMVVSIDTSHASEENCFIYCPEDGVECVYQNPDGRKVWAEKGPSSPSVIEGPCDVIMD